MNWRTMPERRVPRARRVPISAVRSITATIMVLVMPSSTTRAMTMTMNRKKLS